MSFSLNEFHRRTGTRFKVYVQSPVIPGFEEPETIYVSSPAGSVGPGPEDDRMYALLPIAKNAYGEQGAPPFLGRCAEPVLPDPQGHFDYITPDDPAFKSANMFGIIRRVLDVWETYLGGEVPFAFENEYPKMELIAHVPWNNAHFGWGYMEFGEGEDDDGAERPFSLNFDVLAHETGHCLLFSLIGMPQPDTMTVAFRGWQESACDTIAMISALHFESFMDHVLWATKGNVYRENVMSRIGELSGTRHIRSASNGLKMKDVVSLDTPASEASHKEVHKLAQPMTGAIFDVMIKAFLRRIAELQLVPEDFVETAREAARNRTLDTIDHSHIVDAFMQNPDMFRTILAEVRDMMGLRLAMAWAGLSPDNLSYTDVAEAILAADRDLSGDRNQQYFRECFEWREILR